MPNLRKLNGYEIAWRWAHLVLHQSATLWKTFTSVLTKEMSQRWSETEAIHVHMAILGNAPIVRGLYLATIQNNSKYIKSNLNVILMFCIWKKKDSFCPERKNSCMFRESGFRKSSPTAVYLFTSFWYLHYKNPSYNLLSSWEKIKTQAYSRAC